MANSILKLKVESSEYDQKLANAAKGIRHLADVAHKGAGELTGLEKSEVDYIKALGDMETKSRSASGQVRELSSTYKELKVVYDQLNEVEKADEGGKALAASLETLRTRAQEAKAQLDSATQSLQSNGEAGQGTSSILEVLKDKFTVNIDAVKLFNMGLQAAETALNVAKDAFFNNEEQLDEWGRVVESSHSLYTGFLNALNTGDISGYLSNMGSIVQAARDAYDAMDELATYNAFNQRNVQRARTGMTESIVDFREGTGSKEDVKAAGEAYKKELRDRQKKEYETYYKKIGELALTRGVDEEGLRSVLEGTYDDYKKRKRIQPTGQRPAVIGAGAYARLGTETFAQNKLEKMAEALRNLNDTELQSIQALGAQADRTGEEIAQVDKQLTRVLNGRQPGVTGGSGGITGGSGRVSSASLPSIDDFNKQLGKSMLDTDALKTDNLPSDAWNTMREAIAGCKEEMADYSAETANWTKNFAPYRENMEKMAKAAKQQQMAFNLGAEAANNLGAAFSQMEDPAARAAGTVISAIANIALGFGQAVASAGSMGPWAWLAYVAAGTAALATTISTVHSLTGYAEGGIVGGNSYSGDNVFAGNAMVNSGELILNHAQQNAVASELQSGPRAIQVTGRLRGSDIVLSIDRELQQSGRGQLLTWG